MHRGSLAKYKGHGFIVDGETAGLTPLQVRFTSLESCISGLCLLGVQGICRSVYALRLWQLDRGK